MLELGEGCALIGGTTRCEGTTPRPRTVGNTGVQLTVGRYGVLVDVGCGLGS
jgi:hypothetical protein